MRWNKNGVATKRPQVGDRASVWSETGHVAQVDENIHTDEKGKQYIKYRVKPDRADWPGGLLPVRLYIENERNGHE